MLPSCDLFRTGVQKDAGNSKSHLPLSSLSLFQIILHSMHKYQPRVHVIRKDFSSDLSPTKPVPVGDGVKTFNFPETVFTTVTAYQNQQVRVCSGEPSACQLSKNLCLYIGEEWHKKSKWETPGLQHTWSIGDDSVVMSGDSWHGLHLAQTQVPSPSAPSSYVIIMSSYVRISSTSWLCRTESCSPLYLKTPVCISLPCDLKAIRSKNVRLTASFPDSVLFCVINNLPGVWSSLLMAYTFIY